MGIFRLTDKQSFIMSGKLSAFRQVNEQELATVAAYFNYLNLRMIFHGSSIPGQPPTLLECDPLILFDGLTARDIIGGTESVVIAHFINTITVQEFKGKYRGKYVEELDPQEVNQFFAMNPSDLIPGIKLLTRTDMFSDTISLCYNSESQMIRSHNVISQRKVAEFNINMLNHLCNEIYNLITSR